MIYGVDIHPRYQAGISIEQIRAEGFDFIAVKVSEGTDSSFMNAGSASWLRRAKACGLLCLGYHYLRAGNEAAQARVFVTALNTAGVPGMLDAETGSGNIANVRAFLNACSALGRRIPLLYLPRWYWQQIGSPSLAGLPALWASHYVSGEGYASTLYRQVPASWWDGYGGGTVQVLQFTDHATVAGRRIDADAYRGTRSQFATLIGSGAAASDLPIQYGPESSEVPGDTGVPDPESTMGACPARRISIGFDPPGEQCGPLTITLSWDGPGSMIHKATWWVRPSAEAGAPDTARDPVPIDVTGATGATERPAEQSWELHPPDNADKLDLVISTPGECRIALSDVLPGEPPDEP